MGLGGEPRSAQAHGIGQWPVHAAPAEMRTIELGGLSSGLGFNTPLIHQGLLSGRWVEG